MEASFFTRGITDQALHTICWTLVHSVWIGIVTAAIAGVILSATRKSAAWVRYQLLCSCLFAFVLTTGYFFLRASSPDTHPEPADGVYGLAVKNISITSGPIFNEANPLFPVRFSDFIDQYSVWIFTVWFAFFVFKSIRMGGGLLYIYRIRNRGTQAVGSYWDQRLQAMCDHLGIRKTIRLLQSELVKVPVTVGHFRPVILIPVGMILQLPYEQVETILIHELAHIRRRDYLVNLLQTWLETIFFFNPGLLWLSTLIREERENCCDDMVLANTSGKTNYLEALLAFHQYDNKPNKLTMALSLRGNQLVNRLKRIINQENKRISIMEKIVLFAGMLGISAFCYVSAPVYQAEESKPLLRQEMVLAGAQTKGPEAQLGEKKINTQPEILQGEKPEQVAPALEKKMEKEPVTDTTYKIKSIRFYSTNEDGANREMTVSDEQNNFYELKVVNYKLTAAKVNGIEVTENDLPNYQSLLNQVDGAWKEAREGKSRLMEEDRSRSELDRAFELAALKEGRARKEFNKKEGWAKTKKADWSNKGKVKTKWDKDKKTAKEWHRKDDDLWAKTKGGDWDKEKLFKTKAKWDDEASIKHTPNVKRMPEPRDISEDQERVRGIIAELVDSKVIKDRSKLEWFGLSENELIVNGEKQPEELQQKLKQKYDIRYGHGLYYGPVKMTGKGIFLDKGDL